MPEIRYDVPRKSQVEEIIGKARIIKNVFYLIKWKSHMNREISWQPSSMMENITRVIVCFNRKIKNKELPYIDPLYLKQGSDLLSKIDEKYQKEKRKWKIQTIFGKRSINGRIYYFIKWKNKSIFQSDWIAQFGLWRIHPESLKELSRKINGQNLPYLDIESLQDFIDLERQKQFLSQEQQQNVDEFDHEEKTKREKLEVKRILKQQQKVNQEFKQTRHEQQIEDLIYKLREKFFNPIQIHYLKTQCKDIKFQQDNDLKTTFPHQKEQEQTFIEQNQIHYFDSDSNAEKQLDHQQEDSTQKGRKKLKNKAQKTGNKI